MLDFLNVIKFSMPGAENRQNAHIETDPATDYIKPEALAPLISRLKSKPFSLEEFLISSKIWSLWSLGEI